MNILFFGDIVGRPGRRALAQELPKLRQQYQADVVLAQMENLAHGKGVTKSTLQEVIDAGVDIGTGGNHLFAKPEVHDLLNREPNILVRPANMDAALPGQGKKTFQVGQNSVTVINLLGEFGMPFAPVESPFVAAQRLLETISSNETVIVDFHAETTSEKTALGWLLDGRVSLIVGTHTHVPTADERILPNGTGFITDLGMVGLRNSSLGVDKDQALQRFLTGKKSSFDIPEHGPVVIHGLAATISRGRTTHLNRFTHTTTV
jgi:hypothetical protein